MSTKENETKYNNDWQVLHAEPQGLTITRLVKQSHDLAKEKGWWPADKPVDIPEKLCLIHSEVSEALEEYREEDDSGADQDENRHWKPVGLIHELADAVIRIADLCGALELDLEGAIVRKHEYNKSRPFRHGGKRC